ncbi:14854_t:CDS:1, partial [Dentiscutata heterogama]
LIVKYDDDKIEQYLKTFINQKKCSLQNKGFEDDNSNKKNISAIANPSITKYKNRSKTKQYKTAIEKVTEKISKKTPKK